MGLLKEVDVKDIKKDFVLFVTDDAFWGTEIDNTNNMKHTPLWVDLVHLRHLEVI